MQTIVYLNYLKYILEHVAHLNKLFQCQYLTIYLVHTQVTKLYGTLLSDFCLHESLVNVNYATFDPSFPSNHKQAKDAYLGAENRLLLRKEPY